MLVKLGTYASGVFGGSAAGTVAYFVVEVGFLCKPVERAPGRGDRSDPVGGCLLLNDGTAGPLPKALFHQSQGGLSNRAPCMLSDALECAVEIWFDANVDLVACPLRFVASVNR